MIILLETLRKYPVAPTLRRIADVDYKVPHTSHILQKGTQVMIPVFGIHHDPEYYPDPTKFDPDRFLPSEIEKRPSITYLPFGAGPRNCIAERFGKMETLIGLVLLLLNFNFEVSSKTPDYLNFDPTNVRIFSVKDGLYLNVTRV